MIETPTMPASLELAMLKLAFTSTMRLANPDDVAKRDYWRDGTPESFDRVLAITDVNIGAREAVSLALASFLEAAETLLEPHELALDTLASHYAADEAARDEWADLADAWQAAAFDAAASQLGWHGDSGGYGE